MQDAYTAQFGSTLYEMFFRHYTEKVWGKPCEELSADWVAQRSKGLPIWTVAREALSTPQEQGQEPDRGVHVSARRVHAHSRADGGRHRARRPSRVARNASVKGIVVHGPNDIEVSYATPEGERSIRATDVVSTIPLSLLAQMITPKADEAVFKAARSLVFRDLITVNLQLAESRYRRTHGSTCRTRTSCSAGLHEPKNWSRRWCRTTTTRRSSSSASVRSATRSGRSPTTTWRGGACADLTEKLGFITPDEVVGWNVVRTRFAYPVYDLEYAGKLAIIKGFLKRFDGLHIVGADGHVPLQQRRSFDRDGPAACRKDPRLRRRPHGRQHRAGVPRDQAVGQDRARPLRGRGAPASRPRVTQQVD